MLNRIFISDLLRNKAMIAYGLLLAAVGWGIFILESRPENALIGLLQVTIIVLPLMVLVFGTMYQYNSRDFLILLLAQPVRRNAIMTGLYLGLFLSFTITYLIGIGIPLLVYHPTEQSLVLVLGAILLNAVFSAISCLVSVIFDDRTHGLGAALIIWAWLAFVFDGLLLLLMFQMADYPIEKAVLALSFLNPIDIARILVIMKTEASALLGLSGAVFKDFFGSMAGMVTAFIALIVWTVVPLMLAYRGFRRRDW